MTYQANFSLIFSLFVATGSLLSTSEANPVGNDKTSQCLAQEDKGPCNGTFTRWSYHCGSMTCTQFHYGGCEGSKNNFLSREDCQYFCNDIHCPMRELGRLEKVGKVGAVVGAVLFYATAFIVREMLL